MHAALNGLWLSPPAVVLKHHFFVVINIGADKRLIPTFLSPKNGSDLDCLINEVT